MDDIGSAVSAGKKLLSDIKKLPPKELQAYRHAFWKKHNREPNSDKELQQFIAANP